MPPATADQFTPRALQFLADRHLATLTTLRGDGTPHVTPVGFTWDARAGIARVITSGTSQKARNAAGGVPASLCQLEGPDWLTLEGWATTTADPRVVADAVERYARRYRQPRVNPARVAIVITVTRVLGSKAMLER